MTASLSEAQKEAALDGILSLTSILTVDEVQQSNTWVSLAAYTRLSL